MGLKIFLYSEHIFFELLCRPFHFFNIFTSKLCCLVCEIHLSSGKIQAFNFDSLFTVFIIFCMKKDLFLLPFCIIFTFLFFIIKSLLRPLLYSALKYVSKLSELFSAMHLQFICNIQDFQQNTLFSNICIDRHCEGSYID